MIINEDNANSYAIALSKILEKNLLNSTNQFNDALNNQSISNFNSKRLELGAKLDNKFKYNKKEDFVNEVVYWFKTNKPNIFKKFQNQIIFYSNQYAENKIITESFFVINQMPDYDRAI